MTSNAGTDLIMKLCGDPETRPDAAGLAEALHPELLKTFKPAFLGRVAMVPYFPLTDDVMRSDRRSCNWSGSAAGCRRTTAPRSIYDPELVAGIASRCTEVESGAGNVDHILTRTLLPELSAEFLAHMADNQAINAVRVSLGADGKFQYQFS